jgi:hypothetical protein
MVAAITVSLASALVWTAAPPASAAPADGLLDCEGVIAVPGGYHLTADTSCSPTWRGDDEFLDLRGHTLTGNLMPQGTRQTVRNGTLELDRSYWASANEFTVRRVAVRYDPSSTFRGFAIEAGSGITVEHSTFENFPAIALDFYFGEGGTIRSSVFRGNGTAISIQESSDVLVESTWFIDNDRGVNLFPENGAGINRNTVQKNVFLRNGTGVSMSGRPGFFPAALQHNLIAGNVFYATGHSAIAITKRCTDWGTSGVRCLDSPGNVIRDNLIIRSGFQAPADSPFDDGITARGILETSGSTESTPYPAALVGFTLSGNRAFNNADLGFDVLGVIDGGRNSARLNGNPAQCEGLLCRLPRGTTRTLETGPTIRELQHP